MTGAGRGRRLGLQPCRTGNGAAGPRNRAVIFMARIHSNRHWWLERETQDLMGGARGRPGHLAPESSRASES